MLVAGLIGDPVDHSLSPYMHNAAFRANGIDGRYELWPTPQADLAARLATIRDGGYLGANVTVPHKQAVIGMLDGISDTATRIGAVNTLIPGDGLLTGDNTDAYGFGRSLAAVRDVNEIARAVVVGAGGASRAVLVSLQDAGVAEIRLVNRTRDRADDLAKALSRPGEAPVIAEPWSRLPVLAGGTDLIVNATSIGWHGDEMPFDADVLVSLPDTAVVIDLTYRATALLRAATARGLRTSDGLPMLIHQGARSFELWTGETAPVDVMTAAVLAEQARRA